MQEILWTSIHPPTIYWRDVLLQKHRVLLPWKHLETVRVTSIKIARDLNNLLTEISAKSKIVPSSVATAFTGDSTDGRSEGTSVISSDGTDTFITPSRRKAHDVLVGRKGIKSHFGLSFICYF